MTSSVTWSHYLLRSISYTCFIGTDTNNYLKSVQYSFSHFVAISILTPCNLRDHVMMATSGLWTIEQYRARCSHGTDTAFHRMYSCILKRRRRRDFTWNCQQCALQAYRSGHLKSQSSTVDATLHPHSSHSTPALCFFCSRLQVHPPLLLQVMSSSNVNVNVNVNEKFI